MKNEIPDNIDGFLKNGKFNYDNFRDSKFMKMREMLNELTNIGSVNYETKDIKIERMWYADQTYYYVTHKEEEFLYIITWYKSRGAISCILFQGEIIDKNDFEYFYNFLREEYEKWILSSTQTQKP